MAWSGSKLTKRKHSSHMCDSAFCQGGIEEEGFANEPFSGGYCRSQTNIIQMVSYRTCIDSTMPDYERDL